MAQWTRVGEIPKKIPVNFVVDSEKYPELAAWIYSFPHGEMGKTVREILNRHAIMGAKAAEPQSARAPEGARQARGGEQSEPRPALPVEPVDRPLVVSDGPGEVRAMDAGTASTLRELDGMT